MFKQWCKEQNFFVNDRHTHTFMDGGKLYISLENLPSFLKQYFYFVKKENISLTERVGKNVQMRFFLDVDLKNKTQIDLESILEFTHNLTNTSPLILRCTEHHGYHLIFNFLVNYDEAVKLSKQVYDKFGSCIDTSVYNTGLRMIGSVKFSSKYKYENRSYITPDFTYDDLLLSIVRIKEIEPQENILCNYITTSNQYLNFDLGSIHKMYSNIKITKITKFYSKYFINTDCKFCTNKGGFHKNAKIYFEFDGTFLKQRCFCTCNIHRLYGKCKQFKSKEVHVSISTKNFFSHI